VGRLVIHHALWHIFDLTIALRQRLTEEGGLLAPQFRLVQQAVGHGLQPVFDQVFNLGVIDHQAHTPLVPLTEEELAALAQFDADEAERVRGHEEEMARRATLAAEEAARKADEAAQRLALEAAGDEDEEEDEGLKKMRDSMKKEKKKPTIPAELLAGNSYEDKLMIVRLVTEQEQNRVANAIRSMIQIQ